MISEIQKSLKSLSPPILLGAGLVTEGGTFLLLTTLSCPLVDVPLCYCSPCYCHGLLSFSCCAAIFYLGRLPDRQVWRCEYCVQFVLQHCLVDTFFVLMTPEVFVDKKLKIFHCLSTLLSTNSRIRHWHCCWICPTITKIELNLMQYLYNSKKWTGWDLNPRPQHTILVPSAVNGKKLVQIPPSPHLIILGFQIRRLLLVVANHREQ